MGKRKRHENRSIGVLGGLKDLLAPIGNVTITLFHNKMPRYSFNFTKLNATIYPEDYPEGVFMYGILIIIIVSVLLLILLAYCIVVMLTKPKCPKLLCCLKYFAVTTVVVSIILYVIELLGWIILHEDLLYLKKTYIEPALAYFDKISGIIPLVKSYLKWLTTMTGAMYLAGQAAGEGKIEELIDQALKQMTLLENTVTTLQATANAIWMFQYIVMICGIVFLAWCTIVFSFILIWPIIKQWNRCLCAVVIGALVTWIFWAVFFLILFPITMVLSDFCFSMKIISQGYTGMVKDYMEYFLECKGDNPLEFISSTLNLVTKITGAVTSFVMPGLSAVAGFVTGGAITGESVTKMQEDMSILANYTEMLSYINCTRTSKAYTDITKYVCSNILVGLSMCLFSTIFVLLLLYAYMLTGIRIKRFLKISCWSEKTDEKEPIKPPPQPPKAEKPKKPEKPEKPGKPKKEKKEPQKLEKPKKEKKEPEKEKEETVPQAAKRPPRDLHSGEPVEPICGNICLRRGYAAERGVVYPAPTYKDNTKHFHKEYTCSVDVTPWIR